MRIRTMENLSVDKFSAVTRVIQKFTEACREEKISLSEAVSAIVRLVGIGNLDSALLASISQTGNIQFGNSVPLKSTPTEAKNIQLSKEQVEKAKELARIEKAKRLGISPKEVNLTPQEAKEAKANYRLKLAGQQTSNSSRVAPTDATKNKAKAPTPVPDSGKEGKEEETSSSKPTHREPGKKPVGVQMDPTGSRATMKTRIDSFRRSCLRTLPTAVADPTALHLVAYSNHWNRLSRQVAVYRSQYSDSNMLDPLRGLPDPKGDQMPEANKLLADVTRGLRSQSDQPGTFVLQSDSGGSFWQADRPSSICPPELAAELPEAVLGEFERVAQGGL